MMIVLVISKIRQKALLALRLVLLLGLLVFLGLQIGNLVLTHNLVSGWFKEQRPTGNPMRVERQEKPTPKIKDDTLDKFLKSLENYYQKN